MRNVWLVVRREYLERVRTRSFLISTILVPVFMFAVTVGPQEQARMKAGGARNLVVATSNPQFAEALTRQLNAGGDRTFKITVDDNTTAGEREALRARVTARQIDGFLWAPDEDIARRRLTFTARETSDFIEQAGFQKAVTMAAMQQRLVGHGISADEINDMLRPVSISTVRLEGGKESKLSGASAFVVAFSMVIFLYTMLLMYGAMVMQSVLDEKSSRVVEVLLATVPATQLMMGKIVGVGAVGLTQVLIWALAGLAFSAPALASLQALGGGAIQVPVAIMVAFPVYFLLGYLLYSASFAAVGAAVNSLQEAQQFNFLVMSPIIASIVMMMFVIRQPNSPLAVGLSLFPFTAPILMYLRIAVQTPPLWQIALGIVLLGATVLGMIWLCARIYRVGILMYGKRPTLPEIIRWLKYA